MMKKESKADKKNVELKIKLLHEKISKLRGEYPNLNAIEAFEIARRLTANG